MSWAKLEETLRDYEFDANSGTGRPCELRVRLAASGIRMNKWQRAALDWMLRENVRLFRNILATGACELRYADLSPRFDDEARMNRRVGVYTQAPLPRLLTAIGHELARLDASK